MTKLTNTDRLIASFEHCQKFGQDKCFFYVGKYTGNGPSVVAALRRRGYTVEKLGQAYYEITSSPAKAPAETEQPAMTYAIKRTHGKHSAVYLQSFDGQWGTACIGSIKLAMTFATLDAAQAAADKAAADCKTLSGDVASGFTWSVVEAPALNYANHIGYSDVEPYEVVREVSAKIIEVRSMAAQLDPSWKPEMHAGGFAAHCSNQSSQKWIITSDASAPVIRLHMRKDGCFYYQGSKFRREAAPRKFHDYNF